ncbi:putative WPP domain, leucine-rich repeat domain superfamily, WPP domain superfamily [Helianthus annuus]|uniref:WPP domain, leucine-rich repeat domain superfamily, WPP domain superfamily n=3 Tax=Helianthus annuus TaxID=4232 RepID=A0A9K3P677_HELAN|nr:RAN GTPase-activating protein 1 isoform X2 [Helianthus annuus]XP_021987284.1 RAN GTPase-activating protein 1 isoform X2 [Helianthus annuus]KAF5824018.1 putative WPP domain, leucine-rich repeat domain superfamily, WPP domain superfamily [Helianthus annuus]KAJ0628675.1 putative WPP domain, leucine-rich repeat domain superfamily, WPP domain superfamily [Helianthus annuus]KAJ0950082.1 putative WPP domain, leucine-rich repeat domain superfamily, WPP domain superfamily [Helianthus annuus]
MDSTAQNRFHSIKLWPPSQGTRQILVERITITLTTPSILSRKYGLLSKEEAQEDAKRIEAAAFETANQHFEKEPDGDGGSAVQLYAKQSSTLITEAVKRGPRVKQEQEEITFEPIAPENKKVVFDISKGKRGFIDADEAKDLLKPLQEPGNKYTKICFSNRSFGLDAARIAAPILASLKGQLTEVDLSDFVAGRPEDEALEVMKMFSAALKGFDLRYLDISDNALGEKGVRAFSELLSSQSNLEELYLKNYCISPEQAPKAVVELIPSTQKLKILHFQNYRTSYEGAIVISELLKKSPILEDFRCSATWVCSEGGIALSEALATCTGLKKLDLSLNNFGVEAGIALSEALATCTGLKKLNLSFNEFGVEAGIALSKTISLLTNVTEIYLSYLNLKNEGSLALVNALKDSAKFLEVVELAVNGITAEAASGLAEFIVARKESLVKILLSENELKDESAIKIAKALEEDFPRLTEVDLSFNMIRRAGAKVLAQAVVSKPGFKVLNINGNYISDEGVEDVIEIFKNSPDLLGPLDDNLGDNNDPEGEEFDNEDEDADEDKQDE